MENNKMELEIFEKEKTSRGDYIYKQMNNVHLYAVLEKDGITFRLEDMDKDYDEKVISHNSSLIDFRIYYMNKMLQRQKKGE